MLPSIKRACVLFHVTKQGLATIESVFYLLYVLRRDSFLSTYKWQILKEGGGGVTYKTNVSHSKKNQFYKKVIVVYCSVVIQVFKCAKVFQFF